MKKILKISIGVLILFFGILISIPYFFEGKITTFIKESINKNIHANVDFDSVDLSLISSFPNAEVSIHNLLITTLEPFKGDTLAIVKTISLKVPLISLLKIGSGKIDITSFSVEESQINILIDKNGKANYDIAKRDTINSSPKPNEKEEKKEEKKEENNISLSLNNYQITNSNIQYLDESTGLVLKLTDFNHSGSGNFSTVISELKTETNTKISFKHNNEEYLNNNTINLDATIGIDLNQNKYSFLENKALINQLPLVFDGFIQLNENSQELDITFKAPSSDFKNFLALVPKAYSKDISQVKTTGNFTIEGFAKGIIDKKHIPKFNVQFTSDNASFKYPDLPKNISNIYLNSSIINKTGIINDTEIALKRLSFKIDDHTFTLSTFISNLLENPKVKAKAKGTINLASISKAYPIEDVKELQGILKADFEASFDMKSIEEKKYKNIKNSGILSITNFKYEGDQIANPLEIDNAKITFNTSNVVLNNFEAKTGNSDLKMNGKINNLIGFIFNKENIKGDFDLSSNNFDVSDFMETESKEIDSTNTPKTPSEQLKTPSKQLKIPSFLDCTIKAEARSVVYDNLILKDVKGTLIIKDEKATLSNLSSRLFDGKLVLDGTVSTKEEIPTFSLNLDISKFDIYQSFSQLELFGVLAPIGKLIQGKINADLNISGSLNNDLTPNLATVNGDAFSEILPTKASLKNSQALSLLSNNLSFIDLDNLDFNALKVAISFENGMVVVKPFNIKYKDFDIEVNGKHGFDKTMDYNLNFDIPAKYLGSEVSNLLTNLSGENIENITIPLNANIGGSFSNPTLKTNMNEAVSKLSKQLLEQQKNKLTKQGEKELNKFLNSNLKSTDSTKNSTTTEAVKSLLNSFFKKKN
ncbi:MAG: AsmA family protein [Flavobacteriaceae bacterium]|nr:AsmA family protein [Flavobacteriaceae bacterium]